MKQSKVGQARRLLHALNLPAQAPDLIAQSKYWNEAFFLLYEEACESELFNDPQTGLLMAQVLPALAKLIPPENCAGRTKKLRRQELEVRAFAVLAGAYRRVGDLARAEATYREALEFAEISLVEQANLCRRVAMLRVDQGRYEEALTLVNCAIAIYRQEDPALFAKSLLARAVIFIETQRYSEAILDCAAALPSINAKKDPRAFFMAVNNLSYALTQRAAHPEDLAAAVQYLRQACRLLRGERLSLPKLTLKWIQGLIFCRLGSLQRGEEFLESARQGLIELKAPLEVALVSLDLSALYLRQGRIWKLATLASETFQLFRALAFDQEAVAALYLWHQAAQAEVLTAEMVSITREAMSRQVPMD